MCYRENTHYSLLKCYHETGYSCVSHLVTASFEVNNALPKIMHQMPRVESENLFVTRVTVQLEQGSLAPE